MKRPELDVSDTGFQSQTAFRPKRVKGNCQAKSQPRTGPLPANIKMAPPVKLSYLFSQILPEQLEKTYEVIEEIARGACGRVYRALHKQSGTQRAIKHIKKKITDTDLKEIEVLKTLNHPNIYTPMEYCLDTDNLFIVSELCTGGSLFQKISKEKKFSEDRCRKIVKQVLLGLAYIHGQKIVHRDIKPENLMFEGQEDEALIKIIDFGLGDNFGSGPMNIVCGTALYVAPEVLKRSYNEKCDIWSLGAVLFQMLSGRTLILGTRDQEMFQKLFMLEQADLTPIRSVVSSLCYDLIAKMLTVDPQARPSAAQLLGHPWFTDDDIKMSPRREQELANVVKNLRNFSQNNYIHNIIYFYTTSCIVHNEEKQMLSKIFLELDTDCDGRLNLADLVIAFQKSGRSFARSYQLAERISKELQIDLNEGIEFKGFISVCCSKQNLKNEEALKKAFAVWDIDQKGVIDIETIKTVLREGSFAENPEIGRLGEALIQREFGPRKEIDFEEFKKIMNRFAEDEQMSQSIT